MAGNEIIREPDREPTLQKLSQQLTNAGVDLARWGKGGAKTLRHLLDEINAGETTLTKTDQGLFIREIRLASATVYYRGAGINRALPG